MNILHPSEVFVGVCNPYPLEFKTLSVLPTSYVRNIDQEIIKEVIPFLKRFESLSVLIQKRAINLANTCSPQEYYEELSSAWKKHNDLAGKIDEFLVHNISNTTLNLDRNNIDEITDLIRSALEIEQRKRIASAGVKHLLDEWIEKTRIKANLSTEELQQVLTVKKPNFWILYQARLVELRLKANSQTSYLLHQSFKKDFNTNNEDVMQGRLSKENQKVVSYKTLVDMFKRYIKVGNRLKNISLEGEYLALENDHLKSLRLILEYDNFFEYSFGHNLLGIPDLILRKLTISSLIERGYLEKRDAILLYSDDELLEALKKYGK
jgi:hypothetical protein